METSWKPNLIPLILLPLIFLDRFDFSLKLLLPSTALIAQPF